MWQEAPKHKLGFAPALLFFFVVLNHLDETICKRLHERVHRQADFPPLPGGAAFST